MADISLTQEEFLDEADEGVYEQGDGPSGGSLDDQLLPPLLRIQKYAYSDNIYDRPMVPRILVGLFKTAAADILMSDLPQIMNILSKLVEKDEIMVRTEILEQIPNVAAAASECAQRVSGLSNVMGNYLLPLVVHNIGATDNQICKAAHSTLFALMEQRLLTNLQIEIQVCPTILALTNAGTMADYQTGIITLISKMVPFLGPDATERVFLDRFVELCGNPLFNIRRVCASHIGDFCAVVKKETFERVILPRYVELCKDSIWGVRKACAEVIMSVSCACPAPVRCEVLASAFTNLLYDESRWVRMSAFQTLGPFISTFADPIVTSLAYNNFGELVVVNSEGTEFRINSPSFSDMRIKSINELQDYMPREMRTLNKQSFTSDQGVFMLFDPDTDFNQVKIDTVEVEITTEEPLESLTEAEKKHEDIILQKNFDVVSKAMYGEIVKNTDDTDDDGHMVNIPILNDSEDIKEIVETVKNAVLSFRNSASSGPEESLNDLSNKNVILGIQNLLCDNKLGTGDVSELNNFVNPIEKPKDVQQIENHSFQSVSEKSINEDIVENCTNSEDTKRAGTDHEEDHLKEFNCYNYWYISPDMPVDPSSPNKKNSGQHSVKQLATLCSKVTLQMNDNPLFNDSLCATSSSCDNTLIIEQSPIKSESLKLNREASQTIVPQELIENFISMTDPGLAQRTDNEMAYHCAYSLPAVALTLGSANWNLLKNTVEVLASDMQYKVRRTVASSLHELALILGPEIATADLTPIFDGFVKDLDEVRIGVLKHLAHFLRLISASKRNTYLPILSEFLQNDNETNWRFRQELAVQLLLAVSLFRPGDASKHIATLAQELLCDKVAAVRQSAILLVTELLKHISKEHGLTSSLLIQLAEKFAHSKRWKRRQTFALLCSELLSAEALEAEQFLSEVMPHLLDLSWDPVANVRFVVAKTIAKQIIENQQFVDESDQQYDGLQTVLRRLQSDKDRDVRRSAFEQPYASVH